jgi:DNA helicase-2/ATP-dependent DNA helicase PcrA
MDAIFRDLTEAQREGVVHVDGPLLILAGPGSGKTRVVTHRIAHMLSVGIQPWQIAALTFTNKAADEMRKRVDALAPGQPVWMGTFHRFCAQQLRRYASMVGLSGPSRALLLKLQMCSGKSPSHRSLAPLSSTRMAKLTVCAIGPNIFPSVPTNAKIGKYTIRMII